MPLTLRITNGAGRALGVQQVMVFDELNGGTMGRAAGNDWVLPDPERHLSGRHAAVYSKDGAWFLADTSSNGVFVNSSTMPVGPDQPVALNNGDSLLLGDYEVAVELEGAGAGMPPPMAEAAAPQPAGDLGGGTLSDNLDPLALLSGAASSPPPSMDSTATDIPPFDPNAGALAPPAGQIPPAGGLGGEDPLLAGLGSAPPAVPGGGLDPLLAPSTPSAPPASPIPPAAPIPPAGGLGGEDPLLAGLGSAPAAPAAPAFGGPAPGAQADDVSPMQGGFVAPTSGHEQVIPEDWDIMGGGPPAAAPAAPAEIPPPPPADPAPASAAPSIPEPAPELIPEPIPEPEPPPPPVAAAEPEPSPSAPTGPVASPSAPTAPVGDPVRPEAAASGPAASVAGDAMLRAFFEGAGLDPDESLKRADADTARLVGQIFRLATEGMQDALHARAQFKAGFRMDVTMIRRKENNPLKFAAGGTDEAMRALLFQKGTSYQSPKEAFEEAFADLQEHHVGMVSGLKAALTSLVAQFEPEDLAKSFDSGGGGSFLANKKARYWEMYEDFHTNMQTEIEDNFQEVLGKYFATAYEEQVGRLAAGRKKS